ncbi:hypothetical protein RRG08_056341 [Elysia crispata]|uniref:Uncharacterized protein n=1 Tax=Elysia crispata TaxID=231223 RepID=A0AAE0YQK4_9GAST|nr:hypothetical protein RRG08_056341 [Elysia crispata]
MTVQGLRGQCDWLSSAPREVGNWVRVAEVGWDAIHTITFLDSLISSTRHFSQHLAYQTHLFRTFSTVERYTDTSVDTKAERRLVTRADFICYSNRYTELWTRALCQALPHSSMKDNWCRTAHPTSVSRSRSEGIREALWSAIVLVPTWGGTANSLNSNSTVQHKSSGDPLSGIIHLIPWPGRVRRGSTKAWFCPGAWR